MINFIKSLLCPKKKEIKNEQEEYWNNKWKKSNITWRVRNFAPMDIRNLILNKSHILEPEIKKLKAINDDETMMNIFKYVIELIKYVADNGEYWKDPEVTFYEKTGDCEDGALLIISIARILGIPAYKIKLCAGFVDLNKQLTGHAYIIYLAEDNNWYPIDWCYYPQKSVLEFKKIKHSERKEYKEIWWTVNDQYGWSQKDTVVEKL